MLAIIKGTNVDLERTMPTGRFKRLLWITLVLYLPLSQSGGANDVTVFEIPSPYNYCKTWDSNSIATEFQLGYLLGFLSAANVYTDSDRMKDLTIMDLVAYIGGYCKAHPEDHFFEAVRKLYDTRAGRD
jgi:hypothetical protein